MGFSVLASTGTGHNKVPEKNDILPHSSMKKQFYGMIYSLLYTRTIEHLLHSYSTLTIAEVHLCSNIYITNSPATKINIEKSLEHFVRHQRYTKLWGRPKNTS